MTIDSSLGEFLAVYLGQDWDARAASPWDSVRLYAYVEGPRYEVEEAAQEARALLAQHLSSDELYRRLEEDHGMCYWAARDGYEANAWLGQVADLLEKAVAQRRDQA